MNDIPTFAEFCAERNRRRRHERRIFWFGLIMGLVSGAVLGMLLSAHTVAHAQSAMLLRLWHDQDASRTVTPGDIPAGGVAVVVTEQCSDSAPVCAGSQAAAYTTDEAGYVSVVVSGTVEIAAPCAATTVQAGEVAGQAVTEMATCGQGVWLPVVMR